MPYDFTESKSTKPKPKAKEKEKRPSLGTGAAEKAAKLLEGRQSTLDKQLKEYGA